MVLHISAFAPSGRTSPRELYTQCAASLAPDWQLLGLQPAACPHLADGVLKFHGKLVQAVQEGATWPYQLKISADPILCRARECITSVTTTAMLRHRTTGHKAKHGDTQNESTGSFMRKNRLIKPNKPIVTDTRTGLFPAIAMRCRKYLH